MSRAARAYAADVERKAPKPKRNTRAFTLHVNKQILVQQDKAQQVLIDAAAFDRITAARPLKPPPMSANMPEVRSAGSRGLAPQRLRAPVIHWTGEGWRL